MTTECCRAVESIAKDDWSLERQRITDESDPPRLAIKVCVCVRIIVKGIVKGEG